MTKNGSTTASLPRRSAGLTRLALGAATALATVTMLTSCGLVDQSEPESQEAAKHLNETYEAYGSDLSGEDYEAVAYGAFHITLEIDGEDVDVRICDPDVSPTETTFCTNDDQNPTPIPLPND